MYAELAGFLIWLNVLTACQWLVRYPMQTKQISKLNLLEMATRIFKHFSLVTVGCWLCIYKRCKVNMSIKYTPKKHLTSAMLDFQLLFSSLLLDFPTK